MKAAHDGEQAAACRCGHPAAAHRRPYRLIAWLWTFEYLFIARPCRYVWWSKPTHDPCACPGYRPIGRPAKAGPAARGGEV